MDGFLKKQAKGFFFKINKSYEAVIEESFLNTLAEEACRHASQKNKKKLRESTLPNGIPIYIKFLKQKRSLQLIRTTWHPTKIEVEGHQYLQFTKNRLPVPDIVLWGSQRIPPCKFGICTAGIVVTEKIKGGENLAILFLKKAQPWIIRNNSQRFEVLEKIAQLLYTIHTKHLIHGDYLLRNIVFTSENPKGRYWIIDLASGYSLSSTNNVLSSSHYNKGLFRMVYSLAKIGFSRHDTLFFLKSYFCCKKDKNQSNVLAKQCLDVCLSQKDHRAVEANNRFSMSK